MLIPNDPACSIFKYHRGSEQLLRVRNEKAELIVENGIRGNASLYTSGQTVLNGEELVITLVKRLLTMVAISELVMSTH